MEVIFDNEIRLFQGDALAVLRGLPAASVDAVVTDPPYSSGGQSATAHKVHLTGKPVPLMRDLLEVAKPGGVVLDPFMGGGSTGLACLETGRGFIGIELSPEYYEIASARLVSPAG